MIKRAMKEEDQQIGMPSVLDKELRDNAHDAFGHQQYANALKDLIESSSNETPFSIGLLGPWGTGKSTIKELYRHDLAIDKTGSRGQRRSDRTHVITFNAWRFGGEHDLKRSLLREAFRQLGGDEEALRSKLFEQVNTVVHKKRRFKDWVGEAFGQILGSMVLFVALFVVTLLSFFGILSLSGLTDNYSFIAVIVASAIASGWFGKLVVDLRVRTPATYLPQTSISFPATSAEEYETLLMNQIETFRSQTGVKCERLVIFVDDLDRLSAPEMVAGLDAIRTFLELPFNTSQGNFGVVFVISCDEAKIAEALHRGRGPVNSANLPGSVFSRTDARRYLDRLFQFRLEIPLFPKQDMRHFALKRLSEARSVAADLEAADVSIESVIERLIHVDVQSPRNAIQLLNAFLQSWWIGKQREKSGIGSSARGVLHEGAVTNHPLALAAVCVLRVDFPDFYECIQHRPEFLHEFRSVVFGTETPDTHALIAQEMMNTFLVKGENGNLTTQVQPAYRKLRQYLASVQDLKWPKRLQPLMRLSEDPVTRQYGDRAAAIHDALFSGDIQGVLEAFGRELDTNELSRDDATLLVDLIDTLSQETEARRINACRVLAGLIERVPMVNRPRLLTPLVRQMVDLASIRMIVGPSTARKIVHQALTQDRREVAERFINDLLHGNELDWKNTTGGLPNLDEASALVRETLDLALEVRENDGLPSSADSLLLRWLLERNITVNGQTETLSFAELESFIDRRSTDLLEKLGADYSEQAIAAFESPDGQISSTEATLSRVNSIFQQLAERGQEERAILWSQLSRLVVVPPLEANDVAWKFAKEHVDLADAEQARDFLREFATIDTEVISDESAFEQYWAERAPEFNNLLTEWQGFLDDTTATAIVSLISEWALNPKCVDFSIPGLDILLERCALAWNELVAILVQSDVKVVPPNACLYLGSHAMSLTDEHIDELIQRLDEIITQDLPDQDSVANYHRYIKSIPHDTWAAQPWSEHLERLFTRIVSNSANVSFLKAFFPSAIHLFDKAPNGRTAQLVVPLFNDAAGTREAYVLLHTLINGRWSDVNEQIGDYKPDIIAERACQFIEQNPNRSGLGDVFSSLADLSKRHITSEGINERISAVIPTVWRIAPFQLTADLDFVSRLLNPSQTADILTGDQPPDLDQEDLAALLVHIFAINEYDENFNVIEAILDQQPVELFDTPDGALAEWLNAARDKNDEIARRTLEDDHFNDAQHRRIAVKVSEEFWLSEGMDSIVTILKRTKEPNTRASLLEHLQRISPQSLAVGERAKLSSHLIKSLPSLSGDELAKIGQIVNQLGGTGALENAVGVLAELENEQRRTLRTYFPNSKFLDDITID